MASWWIHHVPLKEEPTLALVLVADWTGAVGSPLKRVKGEKHASVWLNWFQATSYLTFVSIKWELIMGIRASMVSGRRSLGRDRPARGPSAPPTAKTLWPADFLHKKGFNRCQRNGGVTISGAVIASTSAGPCWWGSRHTWRYRPRRCTRQRWSLSWTAGRCGTGRQRRLEDSEQGVRGRWKSSTVPFKNTKCENPDKKMSPAASSIVPAVSGLECLGFLLRWVFPRLGATSTIWENGPSPTRLAAEIFTT